LPPTAPTETYTLSLHDALPISYLPHPPFLQHDLVQRILDDPLRPSSFQLRDQVADRALFNNRVHRDPLLVAQTRVRGPLQRGKQDRKSTRLNSSHDQISYAVFC